jgi:hypothetical protein
MPPHVAPSAPSFVPLADVDDAGAVVAAGAVVVAGAEDVSVAGEDDAAGVADAFVGVVAVDCSLPPPHATRSIVAPTAIAFRVIMAPRLSRTRRPAQVRISFGAWGC